MTSLVCTKRVFGLALFMFIAFLGFLAVPQVYGQVTGGTILGTVTDASGSAVPNAEVTITNTATGVVNSLMTNDSGLYSAPNLLPGPYTVTVKATGFSTSIVKGIDLTVGQQQAINVSLKVGETSQQVEVSASAIAVETASSETPAMSSPGRKCASCR